MIPHTGDYQITVVLIRADCNQRYPYIDEYVRIRLGLPYI